MNFIQKLLTQRIMKLEADSKKLELVHEWASSYRRRLDDQDSKPVKSGDAWSFENRLICNECLFEELEEILQ